MNAIIEHVWTPDELARQGSLGIDNVTAEELERLQQLNLRLSDENLFLDQL